MDTVVTGFGKDQGHEVSRLVAGGSTQEDRETNDQKHPAKLSRPTTVAEFIRNLCCDDHTLVDCQRLRFIDLGAQHNLRLRRNRRVQVWQSVLWRPRNRSQRAASEDKHSEQLQ
jgi:hypothetical protein